MNREPSDAEMLELLNVPFCFWSGLPPCPKCKGNHGDPSCSAEEDNERREALAAAILKAQGKPDDRS